MQPHIFDTYAIFDVLRIVEIILAFMLGAALSRIAIEQRRRGVSLWRTWFLVALISFSLESAFSGVEHMGRPPTVNLFFNTIGLIFSLLAMSKRISLKDTDADQDLI